MDQFLRFCRWLWTPTSITKPDSDAIDYLFSMQSTSTTDGRNAIRTAAIQTVLLPDLAAIVTEYIANVRYTWQPLSTPAVSAKDAVAVSRFDIRFRQCRLIATQPICTERPRRWRILTEFRNGRSGFVAIGITRSKTVGEIGSIVGTYDDILVSVVDRPVDSYDLVSVRNVDVFYAYANWRIRGFSQSVQSPSVTLVEFDPIQQLLTVTFRDGTDVVRRIEVVLPAYSSSSIWYPAVVIRGTAAVAFLDWPDDIVTPDVDNPHGFYL